MPDINTFSWPWSAAATTRAVNRLPNLYGKIGAMGLFPPVPISTTTARVDIRDRTLTVLAAQSRGAPAGQTLGRPDESMLLVPVPHFPGLDVLTPEDIQDRFAHGSMELRSVQDAALDFLQHLRMQHDISLEYLRMTALKGELRDGSGDVLLDSFAFFAVTKKIVYFDLANPNADPKLKCYEVSRHIEDNLRGETMDGVHVEVSREFMDALTTHPMVKEVFNYAAAGQNVEDVRKRFSYGGLVFSEYNATVTLKSGSTARMIAAGYGHAFPTGTTQQTHLTYAAPANRMGAVNRPGELIAVSPHVLPHDAGLEFKSEMNGLPLWRRPEVLVECRMGAAPG